MAPGPAPASAPAPAPAPEPTDIWGNTMASTADDDDKYTSEVRRPDITVLVTIHLVSYITLDDLSCCHDPL